MTAREMLQRAKGTLAENYHRATGREDLTDEDDLPSLNGRPLPPVFGDRGRGIVPMALPPRVRSSR